MPRHVYNAPPADLICETAPAGENPLPLSSVLVKDGAYAFGPLTVAVGESDGAPLVIDLKKTENIVVGADVLGDLLCINFSVLLSLVCTSSPDDVKIVLIDTKYKLYDNFLGLPHLLFGGVFRRADSVLRLFTYLRRLVFGRYAKLMAENAANVDEYNAKEGDAEPMPHIVIAICEYADLRSLDGYDEIAECIEAILSHADVTGVHFLATSRLYGSGDFGKLIDFRNMSARIAYRVDAERSAEVIGTPYAESLGQSEIMFCAAGSDKPVRARGLYSYGCEERTVKYVAEHNRDYEVLDFDEIKPFSADDHDPLMLDVLYYFVHELKFANAMSARRRLGIGAARMDRIMKDIAEQGFLGEMQRPKSGAAARRVLLSEEEFFIRFPFYKQRFGADGDGADESSAQSATTAEELLDGAFPPTLRRRAKKYLPPPVDLLCEYPNIEPSDESLERTKNALVAKVSEALGESVEVREIKKGPVVSSFTLSIPSDHPIIVDLLRDKLSCVKFLFGDKRPSRVASVSFRRTVTIEVPNEQPATVGLREVLLSDSFKNTKTPYIAALGMGLDMRASSIEVGYYPNLFVFGDAGSGKTSLLRSMIVSLMYSCSPDQARFILIDTKKNAFDCFAGMPHLLFDEIIHTPEHAYRALQWAYEDIARRLAEFDMRGCASVFTYEERKTSECGALRDYPHVIIVIDDLSELIHSPYGESILGFLAEIAPKGRESGINVIYASSTPERDLRKTALSSSIAYDIDMRGNVRKDEKSFFRNETRLLLGKGDMIFGSRVQAAYVSEDEIANIVGYVSSVWEKNPNAAVKRYIDEYAAKASNTYHVLYLKKRLPEFENAESEKLFVAAARRVAELGAAESADLQYTLGVSYVKVMRILQTLVKSEMLDTHRNGKYIVRISPEECNALFGNK